MRALAEITDANRVGASVDDIHDLFQHASKLLDIVGEEIANEPPGARDALRSALTTLRKRLAALDHDMGAGAALMTFAVHHRG